jgi:hypothetical protein
MQIHGRWQTSTLLPLSSNVGINDTPSFDTWHGKPGNALLPLQSSAGNDASGLIAGLPSRPYSTRNASACSCCVAAHRRTPCRFGVITDHFPPLPSVLYHHRPGKYPLKGYSCHGCDKQDSCMVMIEGAHYHNMSGIPPTNEKPPSKEYSYHGCDEQVSLQDSFSGCSD